MPGEPNGGGIEQIVYLSAIGVASALAWFKSYRDGHKAEAEPKKAQSVVLESAEIADLSTITRLCRDLKPGLEKLAGAMEGDQDLRRENGELLRDILGKVTRLDNELEIKRRVREEEVLRKQRHGLD